jgi:hypothetical protein
MIAYKWSNQKKGVAMYIRIMYRLTSDLKHGEPRQTEGDLPDISHQKIKEALSKASWLGTIRPEEFVILRVDKVPRPKRLGWLMPHD